MQGKPKYITLHTSIRPLKTVTSEITAVHARVRVNTYAACATISHLLPLPEHEEVSTIQSVVLTAHVFQFFYTYVIQTAVSYTHLTLPTNREV